MARILRSLKPEDFQRKGGHSRDGALTLEELLKRITGHIPHHVRFIEEKKRALRRAGERPAEKLGHAALRLVGRLGAIPRAVECRRCTMAFQVLFHGTSSIFLKCLLKCGLLPRSKTKNSAYEGKLTSSEDRVYLTSVYPLMFGMNAVHKFGGDLLIVQSRVSESRLEPDTDFTDEGLHERKFANWNECLENTGCVCVQGVVRPSRMFLLDAKSETDCAGS